MGRGGGGEGGRGQSDKLCAPMMLYGFCVSFHLCIFFLGGGEGEVFCDVLLPAFTSVPAPPAVPFTLLVNGMMMSSARMVLDEQVRPMKPHC